MVFCQLCCLSTGSEEICNITKSVPPGESVLMQRSPTSSDQPPLWDSWPLHSWGEPIPMCQLRKMSKFFPNLRRRQLWYLVTCLPKEEGMLLYECREIIKDVYFSRLDLKHEQLPILIGTQFNRGYQVNNSKQRYIDKGDCSFQRTNKKE